MTLMFELSLGARCIVHPGVVIGADGFGFAPDDGRWEKIEQLGAVRIGDDVEIGANTCIDRGALDDTVIEDGVKLDNLIQIGHNVHIGAHTAMAGCVGIAGSAAIGAHCTIGGGAASCGHLRSPTTCIITAATHGHALDHQGRASTAASFPFDDNASWEKNAATLRQLHALRERLRALEKKHDMTLDIHQILKQLPHRYPFLLVDRVLELEHGKRIKALKNVTINEPFFVGHFPHRPVMPGVLMLEALAQAAALLSFDALGVVARRQHGLLLRRHRRRALQAPGRAGRPADPRRDARAREGRHLQVQAPGHGRRRAGGRGAADVHDAHASTERQAAHGDDPSDGDRRGRRRAGRHRSRSAPMRIVAQHVRIGAGTSSARTA